MLKVHYTWSKEEKKKLDELIRAGKKRADIVKYWEKMIAKKNPLFHARSVHAIQAMKTSYKKKGVEKVSLTDDSEAVDKTDGGVGSGIRPSDLGETCHSDRSYHAGTSSNKLVKNTTWNKEPSSTRVPEGHATHSQKSAGAVASTLSSPKAAPKRVSHSGRIVRARAGVGETSTGRTTLAKRQDLNTTGPTSSTPSIPSQRQSSTAFSTYPPEVEGLYPTLSSLNPSNQSQGHPAIRYISSVGRSAYDLQTRTVPAPSSANHDFAQFFPPKVVPQPPGRSQHSGDITRQLIQHPTPTNPSNYMGTVGMTTLQPHYTAVTFLDSYDHRSQTPVPNYNAPAVIPGGNLTAPESQDFFSQYLQSGDPLSSGPFEVGAHDFLPGSPWGVSLHDVATASASYRPRDLGVFLPHLPNQAASSERLVGNTKPHQPTEKERSNHSGPSSLDTGSANLSSHPPQPQNHAPKPEYKYLLSRMFEELASYHPRARNQIKGKCEGC